MSNENIDTGAAEEQHAACGTKQENKKAVTWLALGHGVVDCYGGFINPILPFIVANIGITLAVATCALSAAQVFSSIMQPVFGFLADKWSKRFFIFWGVIIASVFLSLTGIVQNVYQLALCLILGGIGSGFYHPQATGLIPRYSGEFNSRDMSFFIAAGTIGFSFGPAVSSFITGTFGLHRLPFAAIFGIIFALMVFVCVPKVKACEFVRNKNSFKKTLSDILGNKTMRLLIMVSVLKSLTTSSFSVLMPFYWKNHGYTAYQIGIAMFLFLTVGAIGAYLSTKFEKRLGYKKVFVFSLAVPFLLTLLFVYLVGHAPVVSFVVFILIGFIAMLSVSINMVLAQSVMPQYKSMISGFIGGFSWGIIGVLFPIIGFTAEKIGIPYTLLIISFIPFVLAYFVNYLPDKE